MGEFEGNQLPAVGQPLTAIVVRFGDVHVLDFEATGVGDATMNLRPRTTYTPPVAEIFEPGTRVALNYIAGREGWRLRCLVRAARDDEFEVEFLEAPTRGEKRDFIRARIGLRLWVERLTGAGPGAAPSPISTDDAGWFDAEADVSAGGIRFEWDRLTRSGDLLDIRMRFEQDNDQELAVLGRVVRVVERDGAPRDVAVEFEGSSPEMQDEVFDRVSAVYHAEIEAALAQAEREAG